MNQRDPENRKKWAIWKFVLTYVVLMGVFLILIGYEPIKAVLDLNGLYTTMIIRLTAWLLAPFDVVQGIDGSLINVKGLLMDVRFGCNGLEAFMIYTAAVLSFPASAKLKMVGIGGGFIILQALNVLRIAGLGLTGAYFREAFHVVHIYIAQGLMIAFALVLFLIWLHYATQK